MATKKRAGRRKRPPTRQVPFRLSPELIDRLDALAARLSEQTPGLSLTRTDALKIAIERVLREEGL